MNIRPFQIALLAGFAVLALLSLFLLRGFTGGGGDAITRQFGDRVVLWGPFPSSDVREVLRLIKRNNSAFEVVQYREVRPEDFASTFVNAVAEGQSPDLVIIPHSEIAAQRSKLYPIPYTEQAYTERMIRDTFVDGAEVFALNDGLIAVPLAVDPLVLYWNRDKLASAGLPNPPTTWTQFTNSFVGTFTIRDNNRNITQSAIAMGEYENVRNAMAVLSLLAIQSGSVMVEETARGYDVQLDTLISGSGRPPMESAVQFYTEFANSASPLYSWNRSMNEDRERFTSGDLVTYFGFGSELPAIELRNPNLNFDIAQVPQGSEATARRTYGTFYGLAVPRAAKNPQGAFAAARFMSNPTQASIFHDGLSLAPVHRSLIGVSTGVYEEVLAEAALIARGWLSPSLASTNAAFKTMIEEVISNRARAGEAVDDAIIRLKNSY